MFYNMLSQQSKNAKTLAELQNITTFVIVRLFIILNMQRIVQRYLGAHNTSCMLSFLGHWTMVQF